MYETDGSYYPAYDVSWSGDGERLVISNGNNGGKMFEGPDWTEVTGTTSNGYYVAHHPTEDTLWYMTREGAISEYELQDVPLVGKSWVQVQNYNAQYNQIGPMTITPMEIGLRFTQVMIQLSFSRHHHSMLNSLLMGYTLFFLPRIHTCCFKHILVMRSIPRSGGQKQVE